MTADCTTTKISSKLPVVLVAVMTVRCSIRNVFLTLMACSVVFSPVAVCAARQIRPGIWELVRKYAPPKPTSANPPPTNRVLHFPPDRSLGKIIIQDVNRKRQIKGIIYWDDGYWNEDTDFLGQAQGDVVVPAGQNVQLTVNKNAIKDLSPLLELRPDDIYKLSLRSLPAGNDCMQYVAHLTGLNELDLYGTRISTTGLERLTQ